MTRGNVVLDWSFVLVWKGSWRVSEYVKIYWMLGL
jgi:hypothetical protein